MKYLLFIFLGIGYNLQSQDTLSHTIRIGEVTDSFMIRLNDSVSREILPKKDTLILYNERFFFEPNTYIYKVIVDTTSISADASMEVYTIENMLLIKAYPSPNYYDFELLQRIGIGNDRKLHFIPYTSKKWFEVNKPVFEIDLYHCSAKIIYFKWKF